MTEKSAELAKSIAATLEGAAEWEKKRTSIPGVFLVRLPGERLRVMLEFNPSDEEGAPSKRKGLYFADRRTLAAARAAFPDARLDDLVAAVESLAEPGPARGARKGAREAVFEV